MTIPAAPSEAAVTHDAPQCLERILETDLLSLCVRPAIVRDRHFVDSSTQFCDFSCYFWLEAEAILLQINCIQHLATEDLVAGLHVSQIQVVQHVRQERQEAVCHVVPEKQNAMRPPQEAGSKNDVGGSVQDRFQQCEVILRVVSRSAS